MYLLRDLRKWSTTRDGQSFAQALSGVPDLRGSRATRARPVLTVPRQGALQAGLTGRQGWAAENAGALPAGL